MATASERARSYLSTRIARTRQARDYRLPPYKALAAEAGVSPMTMLKALREYRDRGIIALSHGTGATLLPQTLRGDWVEPAAARAHQASRWRAVGQALYRDIVEGYFAPAAHLPQHKALQQRYGASYSTVRHALEDLRTNGYLERNGRAYRVPTRATGRTSNTVVLITFGGERRGSPLPQYQSQRCEQHLQSIQQACVQAGLRLEPLIMYYSGGRLRGMRAVRELARPQMLLSRSVLGFVVWEITLPAHAVATVLRVLATTARPVCLLNEGLRHLVPAEVARSELFRHFRLAGSVRDGRVVGDYLLRKGYRSFAFVNSRSMDDVGRARLAGLREACSLAGPGCEVEVVCPSADTAIAPAVGDMGRLFALAERINRRIATRRAGVATVRGRNEIDAVLAIDAAASRRARRERLFAALSRFTRGAQARAWVAYNDETAADCLDFLECAGIATPDTVAVMGFDDSLIAMYHQLTSYNFGGDACMHAMISHIVNPTASGRLAQPVEFDGYVVQRRTA